MKSLFPLVTVILVAFLSVEGWSQGRKQAKIGPGVSIEVPTDWRVLKAPENVAFLSESADQNATVTVVEEKKAEYEVENLKAFHQLTVDFYAREVWPDLASEEAREGTINGLPAVFSKISPTLDLGEGKKLKTRGYITVYESPTHYYTVTIVSSAGTFQAREQQLLDILRSFKAK